MVKGMRLNTGLVVIETETIDSFGEERDVDLGYTPEFEQRNQLVAIAERTWTAGQRGRRRLCATFSYNIIEAVLRF